MHGKDVYYKPAVVLADPRQDYTTPVKNRANMAFAFGGLDAQ